MKLVIYRLLLVVSFVLISSSLMGQGTVQSPLFPVDIAVMPDGAIAIANRGTKSIDIYGADKIEKIESIQLNEAPTGMVVSGDKLYVTTFSEEKGAGNLVEIARGKAPKITPVGYSPTAPTMSADGSKIYILDQFKDQVKEVDPATGAVTRTVTVLREPKGAVVSRDGKYMFVTNFLPLQRADLDYVAADVSVINLADFTIAKNIKLASGSNALRGISLTADGKYVLVSHNLGRFAVPTSQLQQGWMNTSAMSVIDAQALDYVGAVVLDDPDRGAAGIWGIRTTPEEIIVTHSGTHDISVIDYPKFVSKLQNYKGSVEQLAYDLRFMHGLRKRVAVEGNGPRNFVINNGKAYIPTYFSDTLNVFDIKSEEMKIAALNPSRTETLAQRGERIFNDATYCFQNWQSCNGCHPGDARTDGMNWDLMNDGIGNSKNCKSLLYSIQTPPSMISGIRSSAELANRKGYVHIQFYDIPEEWATWVDAYTKSLKALPSPYLVNGELSEKAVRGRKVFEKFNCQECHSGIYYTDMKMHRIGENIEFENGWDTPTLREVWRTAPYLFNGRATTMREVFEVERHGIDKKITSKELDDLVEYVNSL